MTLFYDILIVEAQFYDIHIVEAQFYDIHIVEAQFYDIHIVEAQFYDIHIVEAQFYDIHIVEPKSCFEMDAKPTGKRNRGRPKTTWRRTITTELSDIGLTMGEAQVIAQDRHR